MSITYEYRHKNPQQNSINKMHDCVQTPKESNKRQKKRYNKQSGKVAGYINTHKSVVISIHLQLTIQKKRNPVTRASKRIIGINVTKEV